MKIDISFLFIPYITAEMHAQYFMVMSLLIGQIFHLIF